MTIILLEKHNYRKVKGFGGTPSEVEDFVFELMETAQPVRVSEDKLEIDSNRLEIGQVYHFQYLDTDMVLWKSKDNTVDIFQVVN